MMSYKFQMEEIGRFSCSEGFMVQVDPSFREGLRGLEEFSHVMIVWVFDKLNWDGQTLVIPPPYRNFTHDIGLFATRSPFRPNPIGVTVSRVFSVDPEAGVIVLDWTDADDGTPILDIKPYHPSDDLVRDLVMPDWCAHWPKCREESGEFDWESEFTFMG